MTTIAYKDGIIAYDSRVCSGNMIYDDEYDKKIVVSDGIIMFMAGLYSHIDDFVDCYCSNVNKNEKCINIQAFVVDSGMLYESFIDENNALNKIKMSMEKHYAIGSGSPHAITAMDMGASAEEAVKMASKRCYQTGGKINTFNISGDKCSTTKT